MNTESVPHFLSSLGDWTRNRDIYAQKRDNQMLVWDVARLQKHAQTHATVEEIPLIALKPTLASWFPQDVTDVPLSALTSHVERVVLANLGEPVLLGQDNRLIDGRHRYLRAMMDGLDYLPGRRLRSLPQPDHQVILVTDHER